MRTLFTLQPPSAAPRAYSAAMTTERTSRLGRAVLVTTATVGLALAAHGLGGGAPPSLVAVLAVTAVVAGILLLPRRRLARAGTLTVVGTAQVGAHLAFGGGLSISPAPHHDMAGMSHEAASPAVGGVPMLVGHVVACVLVSLLLAHLESVLWHLAVALGVVPAVARPLVGARGPRRTAATRTTPLLLDFLTVISVRGPPVGAALP